MYTISVNTKDPAPNPVLVCLLGLIGLITKFGSPCYFCSPEALDILDFSTISLRAILSSLLLMMSP